VAACPDGIDVYFDNVGGVLLDMALPMLFDGRSFGKLMLRVV
jgi:NADPH-dependent curcumin reductase CurA